jgi:hypothetical protein
MNNKYSRKFNIRLIIISSQIIIVHTLIKYQKAIIYTPSPFIIKQKTC